MTWEEVKAGNAQYVIVESYGYMEKSSFSSHFEPFKNKRKFKFAIDRDFDMLDHKWLFLEEKESDLTFERRDDGEIYLDDPDLWARPD